MYRYSQNLRGSMVNTKLQRRILRILVLVLLAALIVVSIIAIRSSGFRSQYLNQYEDRVRYEANQALSITNSIARPGSTTNFGPLSRVRQHVYAIQTLQDGYLRLTGDSTNLTEDVTFTRTYELIEAYDNALKSSKTTTEIHDQLLTAMQTFYNTIMAAFE